MDYLSFIKSKIVADKENLFSTLNQWRFKNEKIVFTNGCFDIVHKGHIEYLAQAAALGTKLVVGLNTDASVKRLKGEIGRASCRETIRKHVLFYSLP